MLFKKRWSDGLHSNFEHVDEFESKFGLFGGDGGDDGGGGGDVGSQVDTFSDMPGSVDVASQVDTFSDIPAFSAAPAAAVAAPAPAIAAPAPPPSFAAVNSLTPTTVQSYSPPVAAALSTPMGIGSLAPAPQAPSYDPYNPFGEPSTNQPLSAAYSPGMGFLNSNAIDNAVAQSLTGVNTPTTPAEALQSATNPLSANIGGLDLSLGDGGFGIKAGTGKVTVAPTFGPGINIGYRTAFKDGGVVSLLRR